MAKKETLQKKEAVMPKNKVNNKPIEEPKEEAKVEAVEIEEPSVEEPKEEKAETEAKAEGKKEAEEVFIKEEEPQVGGGNAANARKSSMQKVSGIFGFTWNGMTMD